MSCLWFENYYGAKHDFKGIVDKIETHDCLVLPEDFDHSGDIFHLYKLKCGFGLGFSEELYEKSKRDNKNRNIRRLIDACNDFKKAYKNMALEDLESHRRLGKCYASMGFNVDAMAILSAPENEHIYHRYHITGRH